jgi:hypothetical protein
MSFIYEINGQRVEFAKEPTDADIDEAAKNLGRPKPESAKTKPVEGSGGAAFGMAPRAGRRPESQQDREASKEMALQTGRGLVTGTLGAPADILNLPGQIYGAATSQPAPYRIPLGSEEFNQMLPFGSDTPQAKLARLGGEVFAPIPTIKGARALIRAPGQVYRTGKELTQGAMEGLRNPVYQRNPQTSFAPLEQTYYPTPEVQAFQNAPASQRPGMLPQLEASQQPSSSLFNSPTELLATALGPKTPSGQNLIPYQGQTTRAFGETVGRDIATEPFKRAGLPSLAGATIGGVFGGPLGAIAGAGLGAAVNPLLRAAELYSLNKLGKTAGFSKGFPEQLAEAQGRAGIQGQMPQTPLLTNQPSVAGPVNPQTMYVAPEGVAGTNINQVSQAGAQQKYAPQPVAQTPKDMALQTTQQIASSKVAPSITPQQQAILDQIRARGDKAPVPAPAQPAPVVGPVKPTSIEASIDALPSDRFSAADKLALKKAELQNNPPAPMTAADEVTARADIAKQQKAMTPEYRGTIIKEWIKGNPLVEGVPIDTSKKAYNGSNLVRANAQKLMKAQIDSIPVIEGATPAQVINAMAQHLEKTNPGIFKAKKKGPSNVSRMMTGEGKFNAGTYDNPISHTDAMKTLEWANLTEPEKLNIVGKSADNSEKYIIRRFPNRNETVYEYTNPKTGKLELEIEKTEFKGGIADGDVGATIKDYSKDINYVFSNGKLVQVQMPTKGKYYSPNMPEFSKYKIDYVDPMDAIKQIKK